MSSPLPANSSLPTFRLVIETLNASKQDLQQLFDFLSRLEGQTVHPARADLVLILDSGHLPQEVLVEACRPYEWATIESVPPNTSYSELKRLGARDLTSDVIVFLDSDCTFEANWLESMLRPFAQRSNIQVLSADTAVEVDGPLSLAATLTFGFPRHRPGPELTPTDVYMFNGVAFRRKVLERVPIPANYPGSRAASFLHCFLLADAGITIWRHPGAQLFHVAPSSLGSFVEKYLTRGKDSAIIQRALGGVPGHRLQSRSRLQGFLEVAQETLAEKPRRVLWLPLALPLVLLAIGLYFVNRRRTLASNVEVPPVKLDSNALQPAN